jgi:Zinc carboxypeptidase
VAIRQQRRDPLRAAGLVLFCGPPVIGAVLAATGSLATAALAPQSLTHLVPTARTRHVLGYSVGHRPIVAWLVASGRARASVLVVGSIAGDEPGGIAVTRFLASQAAVTGVRLWLIPDGASRGTRVNADGVDLNRNFSFRWQYLGAPGSRFYSGPRPSSEPESRAIEAFIKRTRPGLAIMASRALRSSRGLGRTTLGRTATCPSARAAPTAATRLSGKRHRLERPDRPRFRIRRRTPGRTAQPNHNPPRRDRDPLARTTLR